MYYLDLFVVLFFCCLLQISASSSPWIDYPSTGTATMSHYELDPTGLGDVVAACGCQAGTSNFPTAALSQMAYGSSEAFGPGCGVCFNLTLLNTFLSDPPFYPTNTSSVVVKVTDLCPLSKDGWCSGTTSKPNSAGEYLNFDLAYPSVAIPDSFFPSNETLYGYTDFGVWNISYSVVPCNPNWAGSSNISVQGVIANQSSEAVCCPADPSFGGGNGTCASYSDENNISPTHMANNARPLAASPHSVSAFTALIFLISYLASS